MVAGQGGCYPPATRGPRQELGILGQKADVMAGKGRQRTSLPAAAKAAALYDAGIPVSDISDETGLPIRTIYGILSGEHKWREILDNDERFRQYKEETTKALQISSWELAKKSFIHADKKLPDASYAQAVFGGAILIDKARLLAGEATEIHEVLTKQRWDKQTDELVALYAEIGRRRQAEKVIEVEKTPESEGSPN